MPQTLMDNLYYGWQGMALMGFTCSVTVGSKRVHTTHTVPTVVRAAAQ